MTVMKRSREDDGYKNVELMGMTNNVCTLMLLPSVGCGSESYNNNNDRIFVCKTCNRKFSTFQALGGHRASHKKLKLMTSDHLNSILCLGGGGGSKPNNKKTHECPICGLVFPLGQALGGHMRRHRGRGSGGGGGGVTDQTAAPVVLDDDDDESNRDRVVFLLDLNLSPHENDLKFVL